MNFSMEKLQVKHKITFICAAIVLTLVVFFAVFLAPQRARVAALTAELAAEKQQVLVVENYALAHPDAAKHAAELNQKIAQINQLLPASADIGGFLVQLEQIAKASNVQIGQVQPSQPINKTGYQEIPVAMTVKGNYFQFLDFMRHLEGAQRFSSVSSVAVQSKGGSLEGKVMVNVYAYGQGPTTAVPGALSASPK